jgi:ElaB/YqjD/DUF883 family membrane-anchored ribosome-binding protein
MRALLARSMQCFNTGILMVNDADGNAEGRHRAGTASDAEVLAAIALLREDVTRLADDLARYGENQHAAAGAMIADAIADARSQVSQVASRVQVVISNIEADMRARIRGKPITSVLVAAGIGYAWRCVRRNH